MLKDIYRNTGRGNFFKDVMPTQVIFLIYAWVNVGMMKEGKTMLRIYKYNKVSACSPTGGGGGLREVRAGPTSAYSGQSQAGTVVPRRPPRASCDVTVVCMHCPSCCKIFQKREAKVVFVDKKWQYTLYQLRRRKVQKLLHIPSVNNFVNIHSTSPQWIIWLFSVWCGV
jgi:hypothetical protein